MRRAATLLVNLTAQDLGGRAIESVRAGKVKADKTLEPAPTRVADAAKGIIEVTVEQFGRYALFFVTRTTPALVGPGDGAVLTGLGTRLAWTNPAGTTWFQVQVAPFGDDGPGIDLVIGDTAMVRAAQYDIRPPRLGGPDPNYVMLPGMTYTWRVRTAATQAPPTKDDWSPWSVRRFRTAAMGSNALAGIAPAEGSTVPSLRPTLTWANGDREVFYYEVQVSRDPDFGPNAFRYWELIHGGASTPLNSYTIPEAYPLQPGTAYYWRVRPRIQGDGVEVGWTPRWSFMTAP